MTDDRMPPLAMSCFEVEQQIDEYLDNQLSVTARAQLDTHLNTCMMCRTFVAECQTIILLARELNLTPIPSEVSDRLKLALREEFNKAASCGSPSITLVKR